ncbi:chaperonin-containing T-complex member BBS12 [Salarias fasciatus]|uniref:chaperonin-containing T-complex member BBS12 n=1 Tax=Salarias fasciatus TaxID=181472 RepID=UPI0011765A34|nr:Bardet-Biedl syndrome 12 protein-like [Salarias fasciatus]
MMLESTVLNNRQHVGLQQLSALAELSRSSLGPCKSFKFVQDDSTGESALVCSCYRILETLELSCPAAQLVCETLQAHQKVFHSGSGCLLFLMGAWSRTALRCLQDGIPVTHIVSAMSEGMDVCTDVCRSSTVSIEAVCQVSSGAAEDSGLAPQADGTALDMRARRKVKLSRHFSETNSGSVSRVTQAVEPRLPEFGLVAQGLSHGCGDSMRLALQAVQMQSEAKRADMSRPGFDVTKFLTCLLPGVPEEHACVVGGCVVLLPAEGALIAQRLKGKTLQVAVVTGDLSHDFRHLGFNGPTGIQRVTDRLSSSGREDDWVERVSALLLNLGVDLILIGGSACEKMVDLCWRHQILVVEKVRASILRTFASLTGAVAVTYATQLSRRCLGSGVKVWIWRDLSGHQRKPAAAVNICPGGGGGGGGGLVTVVLTSSVHGKLPSLEERFWACAYRLHYALQDRALLPGAGRTEMLCIHRLLKLGAEGRGGAGNRYRAAVFQLMADGLIDYFTTVMVNTGRCSVVHARTLVNQQLQNRDQQTDSAPNFPQLLLEGERQEGIRPEEPPAREVYDNLSVKLEVWRKALDVVFLILQTDTEILTGGGQHSDSTDSLLL